MTKKEKIICTWECFYSNKSELNLFGKIILTPLILPLAIMFTVLDLLFSK